MPPYSLGKNLPYLHSACRSLLLVFTASLVFFAPKSSYAIDVTLAWNANIETDLAGYRIYHREDGQTYDYDDPLWEGSDTVCTVYNLDETVNHYFVARAFDISENESGDSNKVYLQGSDNIAPTADAGPDLTVDEGMTVTLNGSNSSDSDGAVVSYGWTQIVGAPVTLSEATAPQPIFVAPDVDPEGASLSFQLTVTDEGGLQSNDTCIVNVSWVNVAPTADAGSDQMVNEDMMVTLHGSNSTDPDGSIAAYVWNQTAGSPVTLSEATAAQPTFLAPYVGLAGEALTFQLTVYDSGGLADTDTVIINVASVNQAPVADAGPDQTVEEGDTVTLDGSNSSDPDGDVVSHLWTQTDGTPMTLSNPRAVNPVFACPFSGRDEVLKFQLTVTDTGELSAADSVSINVYPSLGNSIQTIFDLKATATGKDIRLGWSPVQDTTGYNIYRSCMSGGPYSQIGNYPTKDKCTYRDNVLIGVTYYYLVRSVKGETESLDSNKASITLFNRGKK